MRPHRDSGWHMDKPEMTGLALPGITLLSINDIQVEECVIVTGVIVHGMGSEFLVGSHQRRRDIMSQEMSLRVNMKELDDIFVTNNATLASFRECLSGDDLPLVVGVFMPVTCDLLTFTKVSVI